MRKIYLLVLLCLSFAFVNAQVNLSAGLVAYYPFIGNANDVSGNNNNPSFNNATLTTDRFGNPNSAYHFDGTDNYIQIPTSASLNTGSQITLCALVKPLGFYYATCHGNRVIDKSDKDHLPGLYYLEYDDGGYTNDNCGGGLPDTLHESFDAPDVSVGTGPYITKGQWHSVVFTNDGTTAKLYVDCVLVASAPSTAGIYGNTNDLFLGHLNDPTFPYWLNGDLDEIRIYNRAINQDEVNAYGGCTSTCTRTTSTINSTICQGQNFNGHTISGTYVDTLINVQGCDSIRTLHLTINNNCTATPTCNGSLGNPVVNITFGSGANPGPQLAAGTTTYTYAPVTGIPPAVINDGYYSIVNEVPTNPSPGWFIGATDHTGNPNGYMAFFNASTNPGIFYNQTITGLCSGTTYQFAAWIANVNSVNPLATALPNVTFELINPITNAIIGTINTGDIANPSSMSWLQYGLLFTMPAGLNSVTLVLLNNNAGGPNNPGNDLVIDDITFSPCGPKTTASFSSAKVKDTICSKTTIDLFGTISAGLVTPTYQWQMSADNGITFADIPGATTLDYTITPGLASGFYQFQLISAEFGNISSSSCRFVSNVVNLDVRQIPTSTLSTSICEGQNYLGYTVSGVYKDTLTGAAASGCDSIRITNLTVNKKTYDTLNISICQGQNYLGHTTAGYYNDTTINAAGCDSIKTLNLTINNNCTAAPTCNGSLGNPVVNVTFGSGNNPGPSLPSGTTTYSYIPVTGTPPALIPDGSYSLVNQVPLLPGWFSGAKDHTGNPNGYMAFFNAAPTAGIFYQQSVTGLCAGTKYQFSAWVANVIDAGAISGGSTQPNITLELIDASNNNILGSINTGDIPNATVMTWQQFGMLFTMPAGVNNLTLVLKNNNIGGASVQGNDFAIDDITFSACGPQTLASFASSKITDTICPKTSIDLFGTVSPGLSVPAYQWQISNGVSGIFNDIPGATTLNYTLTSGLAAGNYTFLLLSAEATNIGTANCRYSSNYINLNVKAVPLTNITTAICEGQNYAGYTTTGTFVDTLAAVNGCDSIRTINLTVNKKSYDTLTMSLCDGQSFRGHTITGNYNDTIPNVTSCDSIMTLYLTIKQKSFSTFTSTICEGQTYLGYTTTGIHKDTLVAVNGCDSIRTINLTVTPTSRSGIRTSICKGQNYLGYSITGTYIDTLVGASITGCDSIRTLNLTVIPPSLSNITTTICEGQSYLGYTNSGTFIDTLFAASVTGCDSIRTLSLIVNAKSYDTLTASICQGQSYLGYTTTGSFNDTLTNVIGCDSIRTLQLTVNAIPIVKTNKDTSICIGTSLYINTIGATTYAWSPLTNLNFPDNTSDPVTNTTSPIQYIVTGTTNGCSASDTLNIGINQIPTLSKSDNVTICKDSSTTIYANGGLNFQWSPNNTLAFPHNVNAPVAAPLVTTVYHVLVTDANNCVNTDSIKVTVRPDAVFTISPGTGACANISTQLLAGGGDTYLWSPATLVSNATIKNPTTAITATTTYTVQIKEKTCGTSADLSTTLSLLPALNLMVSKSNDLDCYTPSATLYAVGADKYVWSPAIGLNNVNVAEPIAKPFSTQQYFVTGTDKNGCVGHDSIIVFGNYADRMIYDIANAFTPNNDGKNDCFGIKYFGVISDFTFMIYNRWGQQMFYTNDPTACWDGTFQGQKVDQDTYVYYLKAITACGTAEKKGTVVLIR